MPVSMEFLRGVLGVIGIACAYLMGRSASLVRRGREKPTRLYGWVIRTMLCLGAVGIRHAIDVTDIAVWSLAAIAFAVALWDGSREKKQEEVRLQINQDDD